MNENTEAFPFGTTWIRADFHLHTNADKEFKYSEKQDISFVTEYVAGLKQAGIEVGAITNHNKFDLGEFKALKKAARKEHIYLLPGIELGVADGANGIHVLIIFDESWIANGDDHISRFIDSMFIGKSKEQYQNENGRSSNDLLNVIRHLDLYCRDYFIIFAHVEQDKGLWHEMQGGKLRDLSSDSYEKVREKTLAFQKVRTRDTKNEIKGWLKNWYPAEVEGSDCKSIAEIGKGKECYLKLGAFSFDAIKYALIDHSSRVSETLAHPAHSYIRSIRFTGGTLNNTELNFSPELNTLIGVRGSGKSAILESLRYALEIPFGEKAGDKEYKRDLITHTLKSGGKIEIDALDRYGSSYTIQRVLGEKSSDIYFDNQLRRGISIRETILHNPIYFGQKDLSSTGEGFENDLIDKLLGTKLDDVRSKISEQKLKVQEIISKLSRISNIDELIREQEKIKQDTEHKLQFYKEHGIEEKLQKRLDFDTDVKKMADGIACAQGFISSLESTLADHEDNIKSFCDYSSSNNEALFQEFFVTYRKYVTLIDYIKNWISEDSTNQESLKLTKNKLISIREGLVEEFAEIERKLSEELNNNNASNITPGEFLKLKRTYEQASQALIEYENIRRSKNTAHEQLIHELSVLEGLWYSEYCIIQAELDKINNNNSPLQIEASFKEDKSAFLSFMKDNFKGTGIRDATYQNIVEQYKDFVDIYRKMGGDQLNFGSNSKLFIDRFQERLFALLTYQVPNQFSITYRSKKLQHHSLGQRASALILFVLTQRENDVIIIDQPEDDLDNQTIYEDVIKLICKLKPKIQFIFATHNPNIPVLGDAELVHACTYADSQENVCSGSIDQHHIQDSVINIMEGGEEAFSRRNTIYQIWK